MFDFYYYFSFFHFFFTKWIASLLKNMGQITKRSEVSGEILIKKKKIPLSKVRDNSKYIKDILANREVIDIGKEGQEEFGQNSPRFELLC